ncbi:hypothetical protein ACIBMZ_20645 [Micromonospora sp. NPDC049900]|uniref:hypothetical protein n=1 Tax=Micromonospora sp. NPDC049900 TaxID=3364275 RepID=UPI00379B8BB7
MIDISDRPEHEDPADEHPNNEPAEGQAADQTDNDEECDDLIISPEALAPFRAAVNRALQPQVDALARQIRVQLPPMAIPRAALPNFDEYIAQVVKAAMPDVKSLMAQLSFELPTLHGLREHMQLLAEKLPPNWRGTGISTRVAWPVLQEEGIPLVWVPRAEILTELLNAPDRDARLKILVARDIAVADDCRAALAEVTHPELAEQVPLGVKAIEAFAARHYEAAQALAVVVVETVVTRLVEPKEQLPGERKSKYQRIAAALKVDDVKELTVGSMRFRAAMAPIGPFFVPWYADSGMPAPKELSRHVTVHQAHVAHYTPGNAAVAVMMVASVLRAIQEQLEAEDLS